jgi:ubiquitin thioesterase protein OTUB1
MSDQPTARNETSDSTQSMTDLSDHEIARLTAELRDSQAQLRPMLGDIEPISALREEYQGSSGAFSAKIDTLDKDGWTGIRRTRRDGDCWYRCQ